MLHPGDCSISAMLRLGDKSKKLLAARSLYQITPLCDHGCNVYPVARGEQLHSPGEQPWERRGC
jgi:hypothetical protein